ncbi:MAG: TonB-dependent receptor [Polyangiales bacterium]
MARSVLMHTAVLACAALSAVTARAQGLDAGAALSPLSPQAPPVERVQAERADAGVWDGGLPLMAAPVPPPIIPSPPVSAPASEASVPTPPVARPADTTVPIEVTVRDASEARRQRASALPVKVIETDEARRHTADLGDVLARTEGIAIQRAGGLGSPTRLSLHGLTDDQIRVFLDGVPLDVAGFGLGIASVPLGWVDRIDVFRGLLSPQYGSDALGGAIDLVSPPLPRTPEVAGAYTAGSFDTHQLAVQGRTYARRSRTFARGGVFHDRSRNDYLVRVRVPDATGRLHPATVRRFHDGYRALGGTLEAGLVDRRWAKRLSVRLHATDFDKELQHDAVMVIPYGGVVYGQTAYGGSLRYDLGRARPGRLGVKLLAAYGHRALDFRDRSRFVYDWFGERVAERQVAHAGEIGRFAKDLTQWEHRMLTRLTLEYPVARGNMVRLVIAPDYASRSGRERLRYDAARIDPLTTRRTVLQLVTGLEHALRAGDGLLENSLFGKHYLFRPASDQVHTQRNEIVRIEDTVSRFGVGDALRVRIVEGVLAKVAYEYATRLPRADELFGDGVLSLPNLALKPEVSHNATVGGLVDQPLGARGGALSLELSGFLRDARDLVALLVAKDRLHTYHANVWAARTLGVDGMLRWASLGEWLTLQVNGTYQDQRNTSARGEFASFEGQRIPNRPYLFANASAALRLPRFGSDDADLTLSWNTHYVHAFLPGWEDTSATESATGRVPSQLTHAFGAAYSLRGTRRIDLTLDVSNLTDARVFDALGVQRPGRAVYCKLALGWEPRREDGDDP